MTKESYCKAVLLGVEQYKSGPHASGGWHSFSITRHVLITCAKSRSICLALLASGCTNQLQHYYLGNRGQYHGHTQTISARWKGCKELLQGTGVVLIPDPSSSIVLYCDVFCW